MSKHVKSKDAQAVAVRSGARVFSSLQREIDHLFEDVRKGFEGLTTVDLQPAIDITETDGEVKISAELPGLGPKDVDVHVDGDVLVISGEKSAGRDETVGAYKVTERSYGAFSRAITLPRGAEAGKLAATMADGVLTIRVPRTPAADRKRIEVKAG